MWDRSEMMAAWACVFWSACPCAPSHLHLCVFIEADTWELSHLRGLTEPLWWRRCVGLKPISDATPAAVWTPVPAAWPVTARRITPLCCHSTSPRLSLPCVYLFLKTKVAIMHNIRLCFVVENQLFVKTLFVSRGHSALSDVFPFKKTEKYRIHQLETASAVFVDFKKLIKVLSSALLQWVCVSVLTASFLCVCLFGSSTVTPSSALLPWGSLRDEMWNVESKQTLRLNLCVCLQCVCVCWNFLAVESRNMQIKVFLHFSHAWMMVIRAHYKTYWICSVQDSCVAV